MDASCEKPPAEEDLAQHELPLYEKVLHLI